MSGEILDMTHKFINISILVLSAASFIISCGIFLNVAVYVDENNTSPSVVFGGYFWNQLYWVMILFNFIMLVLSVIRLLRKQ